MNEKAKFAQDWANFKKEMGEVDNELQVVEVIDLYAIYRKDQRCHEINGGSKVQDPYQKRATEKQKKCIYALAKKLGVKIHTDNVNELTRTEASELIDKLRAGLRVAEG